MINFLICRRVSKDHMHHNEKVGDPNSYSDYRFTVAGNQNPQPRQPLRNKNIVWEKWRARLNLSARTVKFVYRKILINFI